jgi:glycosyltransferase involved in cell wall biosynthesis
MEPYLDNIRSIMKILIGSTSFYAPNISGVGISTHLLAVYLQAKGHQVYVITPGNRMKDYREKSELGGVPLYRLKSIKNPFRQGFYIPFFPASSVKKIIHQLKPDIVHLQDPMPMNMILQKEAKKMNIPVVVTNHFTIDYVLAYVTAILRPIVKIYFLKKLISFYNRCDVITCPTETIVQVLISLGVKKPVFALSNGVDINRFSQKVNDKEIRKEFNLPLNKNIILYLGRVDKDKSIDVLLRSIPRVLAKEDVHFIIAGTGDLSGHIKKYIRESNLEKNVTVTGRVNYESEKLVSIYQIANIFVIPSTIETQSIVTLEAMASSKPIIAANAGALPELVKMNENGFLFEPASVNQLTDLIIKLSRDKNLQQKMGKNSFQFVSKHDLIESQSRFEKLYLSTLKAKKNDRA